MINTITKQTRNESLGLTDKQTRYKEILGILKKENNLTAREICYKLGYRDLNAVKPRLTELKEKGIVMASDIKKDNLTSRNVAAYSIIQKLNTETNKD